MENKTVLRPNFLAVLCVLLVGAVGIAPAAQGDPTPSKELVQYVHDAKRRGIAEDQIKSQAVAAGWPETAVNQAIASEKNTQRRVLGGDAPEQAKPQTATAISVPEPPVNTSTARVNPTAAPASAAVPTAAPRAIQASDEYLIGSGDTLQISVWKEPEASVPSVVVRPDGKVTMPLIKEVEVAGLTPRQAESAITERLGKFINEPNVTVVVAAITSKKIYLIGAVRKEGTLPYTYGMTVMQALSEAGGLTDYAKRKKIYILRTENSREYRLDFNYDEVLRGERMEQNGVLLPGDTVVIPQ
jgi:polysaccharide export outer membrane protein